LNYELIENADVIFTLLHEFVPQGEGDKVNGFFRLKTITYQIIDNINAINGTEP